MAKNLTFNQLKLQFMLKFFTLLLASAILSLTAVAQTKNTNQFGVSAGLNFATVTTSAYTNSDYRTGFNFGISLDHFFSESWSIKGKLAYDQKGWKGYLETPTDQFNTTYNLDYLTIPVMANWHFGRTKNWYLNFGPYVGILLNAKETTGGSDVKNIFNTTDAGLDVGIGVKFPVSEKAKFFIEVNGQGGIADILKDNTYSALRNSVSNLNIGLNF